MPKADRQKRARVESVHEAEKLHARLLLAWLNTRPNSAKDARLYGLCARARVRAERRKVAL